MTKHIDSRFIEEQRLSYVCNNIPSAVFTVVLGSVIVYALFVSRIEPLLLYLWLFGMLVVCGLRFYAYTWIKKRLHEYGSHAKIEQIIIATSFATGLFWAIGSIGFSYETDIFYWVFWLALLLGFASGSVYSMSASMPAFAAYFFPTLIPMTCFLLMQSDSRSLLMGALMVLFIVAVWIIARNTNKALLNNFHNTLKMTQEARRADEASQAKSHFLAVMSHELRTPLHSIIGLLENLSRHDQTLAEKQQQHLRLALQSSLLLQELIDDVLDLSKIEAGKIGHHPQTIQLDDFLRKTLLPLSVQAKSKQLSLSVHYHHVPSMIKIDASHLRQILLNIVGNALKFTHEGSIELDIHFNEQTLIMHISDTGIGIAKAYQNRLFEPFVQLSSGCERKGTGLGTTISQRLCEASGGSISVDSEVGKGSTFHIHLPTEVLPSTQPLLDGQQDFLQQDINKPESQDIRLGKIKVLIAEDNAIARMLTEESLQEAGVERIDCAEDGLQAWQYLQSNHYDLLLTDLRMPGLTGIQLCEKIRQQEADQQQQPLCILGLSADATDDVINHCMQAGMTGFISKPISPQNLLMKLAEQWPSND